jgi:hypothetical protein
MKRKEEGDRQEPGEEDWRGGEEERSGEERSAAGLDGEDLVRGTKVALRDCSRLIGVSPPSPPSMRGNLSDAKGSEKTMCIKGK